jgi:hypothetical protein
VVAQQRFQVLGGVHLHGAERVVVGSEQRHPRLDGGVGEAVQQARYGAVMARCS